MVIDLLGKFRAEHEFRQHALDLLRGCIRVTLFDAAHRQCFDGLIQSIHNGNFFPGGHAPDEFDLHSFYFGWVSEYSTLMGLGLSHLTSRQSYIWA